MTEGRSNRQSRVETTRSMLMNFINGTKRNRKLISIDVTRLNLMIDFIAHSPIADVVRTLTLNETDHVKDRHTVSCARLKPTSS